jgi:ubiquinone/menaquinone biosynthesis C-methylase UbiE
VNIDQWQKNWDALGKDDPLWVILTDPKKKGGKWNPEEFFETGRSEIEEFLEELESKNILLRKGRALDFGCGVGRLSQALALHFERVDGVDISPSMIEAANQFSRFPGKCHYYVNAASDLALFADNTFDFIYSNIALQHIEPRFSRVYLREFIRVLSPGGVAFFQILSATFLRRMFPPFLVDYIRKYKLKGEPLIGMFGVPRKEIDYIFANSTAAIVERTTNKADWRWLSHRYIVRRNK